MSAPHPLFLRVAEEHQYRGTLAELLRFLRPRAYHLGSRASDADHEADRDFAWVVLPGGAIVGLRILGDKNFRKELRIARQERPKDAAASEKWQKEIEVFLRHFKITPLDGHTPSDGTGWRAEKPHPNDEAKGVAAARFIELRKGEVYEGWARCATCWNRSQTETVVEWHPSGGIEGQRCQPHAIEAGRAADDRQLSLVPDDD